VLAAQRWPWRMHATYDETITRALDVFEIVNRDIPFDGIHWMFDHAETISDRNIERIARLGGGIAVQHRMAYQGESFVARYGARAAERTPPIKRMLELGVPVGAGTDATRVASYDPWTALSWLVTGKTLGGLALYPPRNLLDRETALDLYTRANTWFSNEDGRKGQIRVGQLADFAVLSHDFFNVPDDDIRNIVSVLTAVDGTIVYADGDFEVLDPGMPPAMPDWSPVNFGSRYWKREAARRAPSNAHNCTVHGRAHAPAQDVADPPDFWAALGCSCWAF
jgi:predicted amidohydrolase YtcJ